MKKLIVSVLIILTVFALALPASAATIEPIQPMFVYIGGVTAELSIDETWGIATCTGSLSADYVKPVKITVRLQQYKDGSWITLKTWSKTGTASVVCTGQYAICSGYTYRVSVTGYVLDSEGTILESGNAKQSKVFP